MAAALARLAGAARQVGQHVVTVSRAIGAHIAGRAQALARVAQAVRIAAAVVVCGARAGPGAVVAALGVIADVFVDTKLAVLAGPPRVADTLAR